MITALLVDDEPHATDRLATLLSAFPTIDVIGTARTVDDAERFLAGRTPDVVFLDIDMPGRIGLDLATHVAPLTGIVFVTAHEDRALDAFRIGAVDYVLKPVDPDRLAITIDRLEARFAVPAGGTANRDDSPDAVAAPAPDTVLAVETGPSGSVPQTILVTLAGMSGVQKLSVSDIAWVEAHRNYTSVQLVDRRPLLVRSTMTDWESILVPPAFGRLSRSLIVQVAVIQSLRWRSRDQTLAFFGGIDTPLPLGRAATARLKELLPH